MTVLENVMVGAFSACRMPAGDGAALETLAFTGLAARADYRRIR
jgi:hypothetical protein